VNYVSAGTIEFLVDADRNFYFLEMNTRIQVEHPVTELVTGVDLVRTQIEIAAGAKLPFKQKDLAQRGWAIECRIYAEDPAAGFVPAPGKIETLRFPDGPGVRNDAGVYAGAEVPVFYDPMISKLAVWGANRGEAIDRMRRALGEFVISGELRTNLDFHRWIMTHPRFLKGDFDTNFIKEEYHPNQNGAAPSGAELAAIFLAAIAAQKNANHSNGAGAQPVAAPSASAWRMLGRLDMLRR
jgi:acetyl-CoA carboxylase biotin carboxylase subunit